MVRREVTSGEEGEVEIGMDNEGTWGARNVIFPELGAGHSGVFIL